MSLFSATFNQVGYVANKSGVDDNTDPVFGPQWSFKCRHEKSAERVTNAEGEIIDERDVLYTHAPIDEGAMIWAPDDDHNKDSEAVQATTVEINHSLDNTTTLYKVIL